MSEISRVPPPIISDSVGTAPRSASPSLATGHLHTAQGEKTVTQLKTGAAVPITTKPQTEHAPNGAPVQGRVAAVSPIASPEQIEQDAKTLKDAEAFMKDLWTNPREAVDRLKARLLNEKKQLKVLTH